MADIKVKARAKVKDGVITVKALMTHPMESGFRKDKKTKELIPANYIETVTISKGGTVAATATLTGGISKNPYVAVSFAGAAGDKIKIDVTGMNGDAGTAEVDAK